MLQSQHLAQTFKQLEAVHMSVTCAVHTGTQAPNFQ